MHFKVKEKSTMHPLGKKQKAGEREVRLILEEEGASLLSEKVFIGVKEKPKRKGHAVRKSRLYNCWSLGKQSAILKKRFDLLGYQVEEA